MAKRKPGRPTELTPEVQRKICATILKAGTVEDAATMAGIDLATLHRWKARGEVERSGIFREFRDAVQKARAGRRLLLEGGIAEAGETSWQARAWLLERTEPKRYALRVRVQVEEELNDGIERLKEAFREDPEILERALSALTGADSGERAQLASGGEDRPDDSGGEAVLSTAAGLEAAGIPKPGM